VKESKRFLTKKYILYKREGINDFELIMGGGCLQLGQRILQENDNFERKKIYGKKITKYISQSLNN